MDLAELGDYEQARQLEEETLARRRRGVGDDHPDTLSSLNGLANDLYERGEHDQADDLEEWARPQLRK